MSPRGKFGHCELCGCERPLTFHHLIPRKLHRRVFFKKNFTRGQLNRGIGICRMCHDGIHDRFDEMTLARNYHTVALLRADEQIARHIAWSARQKKT